MHWNKLERWEKIIFIVLCLLALFTRLYMLGDRVMSHDESLHTKYSWNLYAGQGYQHNPMMHGPLLFHVTALAYFLFGVNDFVSRLLPALAGMC
jgi:predicted membrane-bound mannosyltransferase